MSDRPEITQMLSLAVEKYINPCNDQRIYWAREVTFDYGTNHSVRVDFMRFKPVNNTVSGIEKGDFYCYEVKSSAEDFHSKNGHNFLGDYNYYVMPKEVYEKVKNEIPHYVGVLIPDGEYLQSVKNAKRRNRDRPVSEMLLMMYRSAARERQTKIITNVDRIRNMTDEDLADFLLKCSTQKTAPCMIGESACKQEDYPTHDKGCKDCFKEWLEGRVD